MVASRVAPIAQPELALAAQVAELNRRIDELSRRTLGSVSVSLGNNQYFSIATDPTTGVPKLKLKDGDSNVLLSNDTVAGWGLSSPSFPLPASPTKAAFLQNSSILSTWTTWASGTAVVQNPRLNISYQKSLSVAAAPGSTATASFQVVATIGVGSPVVISPADTLTNSVAGTEIDAVTTFPYDFPTDVFGQLVTLSYQSELTAQTGGDSVAQFFSINAYGSGRS